MAILAQKKIYIENSGFLEGIFTYRSPEPGGDFEIPEGTACCPRGFQNPRTGDGDLQVKIPEQKPEFYIYFCIFKQTSHYNLYTNQLNFGHTIFTIPHSLSRVIHIFNSFLHKLKIISLDLSTQTLLFNHLIMNNFQTRFMSKPLEIKHIIIFKMN